LKPLDLSKACDVDGQNSWDVDGKKMIKKMLGKKHKTGVGLLENGERGTPFHRHI
jgi:hypothetical protein